MVARALVYGYIISRFCKSRDAKVDRAARVTIILSRSQEILATCGRRCRRLCSRVEVCANSCGDQLPRFWPREAIKHVCGVGFIRKRLDVHKFDKGGTDCLGYDLRHSGKIATVICGSYVMPWFLDLKTIKGIVDLCHACMNLLYSVEMFV